MTLSFTIRHQYQYEDEPTLHCQKQYIHTAILGRLFDCIVTEPTKKGPFENG